MPRKSKSSAGATIPEKVRPAHDAIVGLGATVVAAATFVDRGDVAAQYFRERDIPYAPVVTYRDLGIEPVGGGLVRT